MGNSELNREIVQKKLELQHLVTKKKNIQDREVYMKSVELDYLVVEFMRKKPS